MAKVFVQKLIPFRPEAGAAPHLRAVSTDPDGANLPREHGPWIAVEQAQMLDPAVFKGLKPKGYALMRDLDDEAGSGSRSRPVH